MTDLGRMRYICKERMLEFHVSGKDGKGCKDSTSWPGQTVGLV